MLVAVFAISIAAAQQPARKIEFEAVSIKPGDPLSPGRSTQVTQGGYRARNVRVFELIMSAWGLNQNQIAGGPSWAQQEGFDIDARFPEGTGPSQNRAMVQAMLEDRFKLVTHRETRILPLLELSIAKGGLRLKEGNGENGMSAGPRLIRYSSGTMAQLSEQLASFLDREVVNKTGLTGSYSIHLSFVPVELGTASDDGGPSIFQALEEQAGLKLESTRGAVEVLVIDSVERPSAN